MNNRELELWIENDESLYSWWKASRLSKRAFMKENRKILDDHIQRVLDRKPER
jgi:hypothetical protein